MQQVRVYIYMFKYTHIHTHIQQQTYNSQAHLLAGNSGHVPNKDLRAQGAPSTSCYY